MAAAYTDATGRTADATGLGIAGDIGGLNFTPGVYKWSSNVTIPTDITLTGGPTDVWIFQISGTLDMSSAKIVHLSGGAVAENVFWAVAGATTIGTTATFEGNILEAGSVIALQTGATLHGRALSQFAVTLDANTVSKVAGVSPQLTVSKVVINNNGGTKVAADFPLFIDGSSVTNGVASTTSIGSHVVTETIDSRYSQTFSASCPGGDISLVYGDNKTCTITNDDIARSPKYGTINVVKTVINDNGGTKVVSDFPLFVNDTKVISGETNQFTAPVYGYTITETKNSNYTETFSGDCDATGHLNLNPGESKTCIITNDDIGTPAAIAAVPPLIDVVKVPSPLALPKGPGPVTYTYTLKNIGTVPVTNVTMVGDTCRPINLISGDVNNDSKLDVNETWVYRCSTVLNETHTNTVVATGWANGLSATDIANATVVVGAPVVAPLIHVTKVPSTLTLRAAGGMVTYTEKVTNPGGVALSNVKLTDNRCADTSYVSGDTNKDSKLGTDETWVYSCTMELTRTTTNIAIASGEANGLTVRDFALATVVVASPALPDTGVAPVDNGGVPWRIIFPVGIVVVLAGFYIARRKHLI